jgi:hypothetical protein
MSGSRLTPRRPPASPQILRRQSMEYEATLFARHALPRMRQKGSVEIARRTADFLEPLLRELRGPA